MTEPHGRFTWYEIRTQDPAAAAAFYGQVLSWTVRDSGMPGMTYLLLSAGTTELAGLTTLPGELAASGVPPHWGGFVAVDDVDATAEQAKSLGGTVHFPPTDIPQIGRFAVLADPQGAVLSIFKWAPESHHSDLDQKAAGQVGWHELMAADWDAAFPFYAALFGWAKGTSVDMGPMGIYQLFTLDGQDIGGMFNKPSEVPGPFWLYYANVDDIDAAVARITEAGGQVLNGPMAVPGGMFIAQAKDPQGAMFAVVGPKA